MASYWNALNTVNQVAQELGLNAATSLFAAPTVQTAQLLALTNSAGNELLMYYPWEQLRKEWVFDTNIGEGSYDLPADWGYFLDQTQWDRTDHWPLIGPKSAQEWAWLKGGLLAAAPRLRYRIAGNKFMIWPIPSTTTSPSQYTLAQEYISNGWVESRDVLNQPMYTALITKDADLIRYDPWLVVKFVKLKFYETKGFDTTAVRDDFMRVFNSLTGKDVGAPVLTLARQPMSQYLGPWSVPDGSWNVGQP